MAPSTETSQILTNLRDDFRDLKGELSDLRSELHQNLISVAVLETRVKDVARSISTWVAAGVSIIVNLIALALARVFF